MINKAPRHEDVLGEWMYNSTHSLTRHLMEVSGQLHTPTALSPGKEPLVRKLDRSKYRWANKSIADREHVN
jgi:hypothetical protein